MILLTETHSNMKNSYFFTQKSVIFSNIKNRFDHRWILAVLLIIGFSFSGYSQKNKDIIPVVYCIKDIGNGLYQASFGYENPTKKEVTINEDGSIIKSNNGKRVAKGLNKFKPGSNKKVFTKEFGAHDYVEWTIISNGKTHKVIANANSSKCPADYGFIFPVIGNGKSSDVAGNELISYCLDLTGETPSDLIFQIKEGKVLIEIIPKANQMGSLISLLQGAPFNVALSDFLLDVNEYNSLSAVDVYFEKEALCLLNDYSDIINFARPVYPAKIDAGGVTTQGDGAQLSNAVRERFRMTNSSGDVVILDGRDISIGILSDSYDREFGGPYAHLDVGSGELPSGVQVLKDNVNNATDEGRAMMQTVHDVAPGASLAFHTATASPRQFEIGFNALKIEGCDIIVDDITFITEPFFGAGRISQAIELFVSEPGKFHITSAGNLANKAFQSTFNPSSNAPVTNFIDPGSETKAHVFGTNPDGSEDYLQKISVIPGTYLIALQYKEPAASQINHTGASVDLDIYLVDDFGRLIVGNNRLNIFGDPTEIIVFRATGTGEANILITSANGDTNVPFRYIAFRTAAEDGTPDGLKIEEYFGNGAPTISGHAMTDASITVGAVDYRKADSPIAEVFSSHGGMLSDGITEPKVDIYAPDGGNTTTNIGQFANCSTCDNDEFRNFYGTSQSAPHLAGAIALIMSAAPSWFPDGSGYTTFTADMALDNFVSTGTIFTGADGFNSRFINALEGFKNLAAGTSRIIELRVQDGKTPSAEPFTVTIIGEFFPEDPGVLFDGQPLTDIVRISDTEISATVGPFVGDEGKGIVVVTAGITPGGTDGGESNSAYFFDEGKIALNIIANNAQFEFGQDISLSYTIVGLPEDIDTTLSYPEILELLGLPEVILNSAADQFLEEGGYPIVFDYPITPSFEGVDYDHDLFQVNFISGYNDPDVGKVGYLTVTKKDLIITTNDVTYTYGEAIDLPLIYTYDGIGISDNSPDTGFYALIAASHQSDFKDGLSNKFQALVSKFQALVSGYDLLNLLGGGSWSASERTIENKFQALVSGMSVIRLDNEHFTNFIDSRTAYDDGTTNKFQALVSKFQALVSAEDLFSGVVDLGVENKFQALVSKFQALVSTENPERPYIQYSETFTIVDAEDLPPEDGSDEERAISNLYSVNMITGIDVTTGVENHYTYPGAFLSAMSANFNIAYNSSGLTILPRDLIVNIESFSTTYGEVLTVEKLMEETTFAGWAFEGEYQESVASVFPDTEGGVPFYFIKVGGDGTELEINELKDSGQYTVNIRNPKNYVIKYAADDRKLTIEKAILTADIDDLIITQGDVPVFTSSITGFTNGDSLADIFSGGIVPYYFVDDMGTVKTNNDVGAWTIRIGDDVLINHVITYNTDARLYINALNENMRKVRTYADCIAYDPLATDGLNYTVIFRYENDNDLPIYVIGEDNMLTGPSAESSYGELPVIFMPGSGTFAIRFNGDRLVWTLTTEGTAHTTSVSSESTSESGKCNGKIDTTYELYPNPVKGPDYLLTIKQNVVEESIVYVLNMYGSVVSSGQNFNGIEPILQIDMSSYSLFPSGMYFVQIVSTSDTRTFTIIKE